MLRPYRRPMEQRPSFDPVELLGPLALAVLAAAVLGSAAAMIVLSVRVGGEAPAALLATPTAEATPSPEAVAALSPEEAAALAAQGLKLSGRFGCTGCHSTDGSVLTGPSWKGLFGTQVTLSDGSTVTVNEAYIRESIMDPALRVVQGFQPVMPYLKDRLNDDDIRALTEWIKSLK